MTLTTNSLTPLYKQVKQYLDELIATEQLSPGEQLPSERELEEQFGVSRITVRHALQELASEDKIQRVPGKGSFVLEPKVEPLTALTSFSENMRAQGKVPSYKDTSIALVEPSPAVATALHLEEGQQALHLHRLMLADGLPMAIQDAYLPYHVYEQAPSLFVPEVLNNLSLYKILEVELGVKLHRAQEQVEAAPSNRAEANKLQIGEDDVVLIVKRTTCDVDENPVEFVKLVFPAKRYRYKVELFRPTRSDIK